MAFSAQPEVGLRVRLTSLLARVHFYVDDEPDVLQWRNTDQRF
jgi:hypothetical protein